MMLLYAINNNNDKNDNGNNNNDNNNTNTTKRTYSTIQTIPKTMLISYIKWLNWRHGKCFETWGCLAKIVKWDVIPGNDCSWIKWKLIYIDTRLNLAVRTDIRQPGCSSQKIHVRKTDSNKTLMDLVEHSGLV
jgi:hypothetical protein